MREFFREIVHALEEGRPVELVSIAASDGSTPRGAGAMMAVFPGGGITGTIGGGNVEFECQRLAAELLERGGDALRQFRFTLGDAASLGMVCGGGVTVQFQYLPAGEQRIIAVLRDLIEADGGNRDTWLLRRIEGEQVTAMGLADRTGPRHLDILPEELELLCGNQAVFARKWLSIPVVKAGRTYLFGGGHVSQALVPVLASLGFRPVVYDDRPEFADPALFPKAEKTLCGDFARLSEQVTVTPRNYPFAFRHKGNMDSHYAMIGMAHIAGGYPLYYDAVNEKGLGMEGLNFVGNAFYFRALCKSTKTCGI